MTTVANCCRILQAPRLTKVNYNIVTSMLPHDNDDDDGIDSDDVISDIDIVDNTVMTTLARVMRQPLQSAKKVRNNTAIVSKRIRKHVAY